MTILTTKVAAYISIVTFKAKVSWLWKFYVLFIGWRRELQFWTTKLYIYTFFKQLFNVFLAIPYWEVILFRISPTNLLTLNIIFM